jgi:hypothetical protein
MPFGEYALYYALAGTEVIYFEKVYSKSMLHK